MGSPLGEQGSEDGEQQHEVTLIRDFFLGVCPVTQAEYTKVMGRNPSHFQGRKVLCSDSANYPVENVSHEDARELCLRLSGMPDKQAAGRQ